MSIEIEYKEKSNVVIMNLPKNKIHFDGDKAYIYFDFADWNNLCSQPLTQEEANAMMFNDEIPF